MWDRLRDGKCSILYYKLERSSFPIFIYCLAAIHSFHSTLLFKSPSLSKPQSSHCPLPSSGCINLGLVKHHIAREEMSFHWWKMSPIHSEMHWEQLVKSFILDNHTHGKHAGNQLSFQWLVIHVIMYGLPLIFFNSVQFNYFLTRYLPQKSKLCKYQYTIPSWRILVTQEEQILQLWQIETFNIWCLI